MSWQPRYIEINYTIIFNFCEILYVLYLQPFSNNDIYVLHIVGHFLIHEIYHTFIILQNLVTWFTDDHRDSQRINIAFPIRLLHFYGTLLSSWVLYQWNLRYDCVLPIKFVPRVCKTIVTPSWNRAFVR